MLTRLSVDNFALIENINLNLQGGFTVITGETGSGKSILLGALQLILGERADYSVIRNQEKKTIVEAEFSVPKERFQEFLAQNELDQWGEELLLRREINASGKSRAFINDTPVSLNLLKELTQNLIHIHSQHHTLELKDKDFQLSILDIVGNNQDLLEKCKALYENIHRLTKEIENLKERRSNIELQADFNRFQLEELAQLKLDKEDFAQIQNEVERGEQFEEIKNAFVLISNTLSSEQGVLEQLGNLKKKINAQDSSLEELLERIASTIIELKDVNDLAEDELSEMELNPEELIHKTSLLDRYNSALQKHNLTSQEELLAYFQTLHSELLEPEELDELIREKEAQKQKNKVEADKIANELTQKRKVVAKEVEAQIQALLNELRFDNASIIFEFSATNFSAKGKDDVVLYFAPNKGIAPKAIEKSASGGELSRLMLAIQYLLSQKKALPTIIFDEIDTGVSGEVAQKIGVHLKKLGQHMQLLAITHLPQVASKGSHHILVEKMEQNNTTKTYLKSLSEEERIIEIAKLMSGSVINEAALLNAKNLMYEQ